LMSISLKNIGVFEERTFAFDPSDNVTLLVGKNGCGKSTILGAIKYLLFGTTPVWQGSKSELQRVDAEGPCSPSHIKSTWTHGGKTIQLDCHIAPAKWVMTVGDEKPIVGSKLVAEAKSEILGIDSTMCDHVAVEQRQLHRWLYELPSKKVAEMQKLFGADRGEPARAYLRKLAASVEAPDLAEHIVTHQSQMAELVVQRETLTGQRSASESVVAGLKIGNAHDCLTNHKAAQMREGRLQALEAQFDKTLDSLATKEEILPRLNIQLVDVAGANKRLQVKAITARAVLEEQATIAASYKQAEDFGERLNELGLSEPEEPVVYVVPDDCDKLRADADELSDLLMQKKTALEAYESHQVGVCPVCGEKCAKCLEHGERDVEKIKILRREVEGLVVTSSRASEVVRGIDRSIEVSAGRKAGYDVAFAAWMGSIESLRSQLKALGEVREPDQAAADEARKIVDTLRIAADDLRKTQETVTRLEEDIDALARSSRECRAEIDKLKEEGCVIPTQEQVNAANTIISLYVDHQAKLEAMVASENYINGAVTKLDLTISGLEAKQIENARLREFARGLESMRDVLHRDKLPARVVAGYLAIMSAKINEILPVLGADYTVYVQGAEFMALRPDGAKLAVTRLSGGQTARFCMAFVITLNRMFSADLGFLCADEPTDGLDEGGRVDFSELLDTMSRLLSEDSQIFIATHYPELAARADSVLDVSAV